MAGREFEAALNFALTSLYQNVQDTDGQSVPTADPRVTNAITFALSITNGTGVNEANRIWQTVNRDLANSADLALDVYDFDTLDIGAGAGLDQFGQALTLTGAKAIIVFNQEIDSGGVLTVGNETSAAAWNTPFNGSDVAAVTLAQGGLLVLTNPTAAGFAIDDTTNHKLNLNATGGDCTFDAFIIGID